MSKPHILIVDDEPNVRFVLERALSYEGYQLDTAAHGGEALQKLAQHSYDLLLLDLHMEPIGGLEVLHAAREQDRSITVIILTAYSSVESAVDALRWEAFDYLTKPASPELIRQRVRAGLAKRQAQQNEQTILQQIGTLRDALNSFTPTTPSTIPRALHHGPLKIDRHLRQITLSDVPLDLTTAEFELLLFLIQAAPNPVSPRELVNAALGYDTGQGQRND